MNIIRTDEHLAFSKKLVYHEMEFEQDDFSFITGKSGVGKSTYLKLLNMTLLPNQGKIYYRQKDYREFPILEYRKSVLLVPQQVFLLNATIQENFNYYYESRGEDKISKQTIIEFLNISCIDLSPDTDCSKLSGGERKRVFIAIFLSLIKDVILLDEPTASLDEITAKELLNNIKNFLNSNKMTGICVCHSDKLVDLFSDKIYRLEKQYE